MATFYWKGTLQYGDTGSDGFRYSLDRNNPGGALNQHWNVSGNWLKKVDGVTYGGGTGSDGYSQGSSGDFHLAKTTLCPGSGDIAIIERINSGSYGLTEDIPLSNLSVGGHYGTNGWVNAESGRTGGRLHLLHVKRSTGQIFDPQRVGIDTSSAGNKLGVRGSEIFEASEIGKEWLGNSAGVSFGNFVATEPGTSAFGRGIRLDASKVVLDNRFIFSATMTGNSDIFALDCPGQAIEYTDQDGTYQQISLASDDSRASGRFDFGLQGPQAITLDSGTLSVGHRFQTNTEDPVAGQLNTNFLVVRAHGTVDQIDIDVPIRPRVMMIDANATTVNIFPSVQDRDLMFDGYQTVVLQHGAAGNTGTYGTVNLKADAAPFSGRTRRVMGQGFDGFTGDRVIGINNMVGFNEKTFVSNTTNLYDLHVDNLVAEGGRVVVGQVRNFGITSGGEFFGGIGHGYMTGKLVFKNGVVADDVLIDLNPASPEADPKAVKIGDGITHPSSDMGLQFIGDGKIIYPTDMKVVADFPSAATGVTGSGKISGFSFQPSIGRKK